MREGVCGLPEDVEFPGSHYQAPVPTGLPRNRRWKVRMPLLLAP